ncbi:hypothetical protein BT96DRAFT_911975 [Gymnopus androsaceus JB14]|uniref:Uncharacterized protein n=1 Tax=Gymnopus androsaceus JB14 TaxID=1447944 RepID=A0A6A4IQ28_9AGAR|nr:hypothetical protein BT96DRAFT_911975 [Gymnopus androsaceus JB14]
MIRSRWSLHDDSDNEDEDEDVEIGFFYFAAARIQLPVVDLEKLGPLKAMKEDGLKISVKTGMLDVVDFI